jgi:NADH:ubiquinone oxidoreductase subunit E
VTHLSPPAQQIAKEEQLDIPSIESCDCLGECGYGPNILLDNAILINNVRSQEDIRQALGLPPAVAAVAKPEEAEKVSSSA